MEPTTTMQRPFSPSETISTSSHRHLATARCRKRWSSLAYNFPPRNYTRARARTQKSACRLLVANNCCNMRCNKYTDAQWRDVGCLLLFYIPPAALPLRKMRARWIGFAFWRGISARWTRERLRLILIRIRDKCSAWLFIHCMRILGSI